MHALCCLLDGQPTAFPRGCLQREQACTGGALLSGHFRGERERRTGGGGGGHLLDAQPTASP